MAYIANKPVRFDRNYRVGEIIPPEVIEPKMVRKLMDMGRIVCVDLPTGGADHASENTDEIPEPAQQGVLDEADSAKSTDAAKIQGYEEAEHDGQNTLPVQQCGPGDKAEFMNPPQESARDDGKADSQVGENAQSAPAKGGEFVCSVCGKSFGSKNALSAHARVHIG